MIRSHEEAFDLITARLPRVPWFAAMAELRKSAVFSGSEQKTLERFRRFPTWFEGSIPGGFSCDYLEPGGYRTEMLDPQRNVWHQRPLTDTAHWLPSELESGFRLTPPVQIVDAENLTITTEPFLKSYRYADPTTQEEHRFIEELTDPQAVWLPRAFEAAGVEPQRLVGRTLVIAIEGAGYAHWMLDVLPRLQMVKDRRTFKDFDHILFSHAHRPYERKALHRLGVLDDRIVATGRPDTNNYFYLDGPVCAITTIRQPRVASLDTIQHTIAYYSPDHKSKHQPSDEITLYLERRTKDRRPVIGEKALVAELTRQGVTVMDPACTPTSDLIRAVRSATTILAPHGAAVANTAFARPGSTVIEFFSGHLSHHFWSIATNLGLRYAAYQCHDDANVMHTDETLHEFDFPKTNGMPMQISTDDVRAALALAGNN